jgi:hypothetical protein
MSRLGAPASLNAMTAGQDSAAQRAAVVRSREHVENVRADAMRAAARSARRTGAAPSSLITDAISWALNEGTHAPFTGVPAVDVGAAEVSREIGACRAYLHGTPWSEETDDPISRAQHVVNLLEWLTGRSDTPPTYCREAEPGDLVGGRGPIVRPDADIRRMIA